MVGKWHSKKGIIKMTIYHMHDWSIEGSNDPYKAPEMQSMHLVGFRDYEDKRVITSSIVEVNGCNIITRTGSTYILEDINPQYLAWMQANGYEYDPNNPIKLIS